jgi:hypothetical protein
VDPSALLALVARGLFCVLSELVDRGNPRAVEGAFPGILQCAQAVATKGSAVINENGARELSDALQELLGSAYDGEELDLILDFFE